MHRRRAGAMVGALGLWLVVGMGHAVAADRDVAISGFSFAPRTVTVSVGDTVTWTNSDAQAHTATSGTAWTTGDITNGQSASITFSTAGTFDYICAIHPTMSGTVVVAAGAAPPTDTALTSPARAGADARPVVLLGLVLLVAVCLVSRRFGRRST